jgi:hypothetical protein
MRTQRHSAFTSAFFCVSIGIVVGIVGIYIKSNSIHELRKFCSVRRCYCHSFNWVSNWI